MDDPTSSAGVARLGLECEDRLDLYQSIIDSFGVRFGSANEWEALEACETLGEMHEALMARLPASGRPGACATSMAFWRLRRTLVGIESRAQRLTPSTPVKAAIRERPHRFFARLKEQTGLEGGQPIMGASGCFGVLALLLGVPISHLAAHNGWITASVALTGIGMLLLDRGDFGARTLGDLARNLARHNAGRLISAGADARPQAVWRVLCEIVAKETDVGTITGLTGQTRLF